MCQAIKWGINKEIENKEITKVEAPLCLSHAPGDRLVHACPCCTILESWASTMCNFSSIVPSLTRALHTSPAMADPSSQLLSKESWWFLNWVRNGCSKAPARQCYRKLRWWLCLSTVTRCLTEAAKGRKGFTGSQLQAGKHGWGHGWGSLPWDSPHRGLLPSQ